MLEEQTGDNIGSIGVGVRAAQALGACGDADVMQEPHAIQRELFVSTCGGSPVGKLASSRSSSACFGKNTNARSVRKGYWPLRFHQSAQTFTVRVYPHTTRKMRLQIVALVLFRLRNRSPECVVYRMSGVGGCVYCEPVGWAAGRLTRVRAERSQLQSNRQAYGSA